MQKMNKNQKLRKLFMAAVALLMIVCMGAGVLLQFDLNFLIPKQGETQENIIPEDSILAQTVTVTSQDSDELLARPQGGKQLYEILEIVPDKNYSAFSYFIGGMEPNRDALIAMSNMGGYTNVVGSGNASTPFTVIQDGIKKEYLESYQGTIGSKQDNHYEIKRFKVSVSGGTETSSQNPGYFQYVGNGNGLYWLDTNSIESKFFASSGGNYQANFTESDLYNKSAAAVLNLQENTESTTAYNYDAVLKYNAQSVKTGYFAASVVADAQGRYVIDHTETRKQLETAGDVTSGDSSDTYTQKFQTLWAQRDYSKIIFREYDSSKDTAADISRYKVYFDYNNDDSVSVGVTYLISEYTYNPGKGEFLAKLTKGPDGMYYMKMPETGAGEYDKFITGFKMTACASYSEAWKCGWVWRQGASADGKVYSTQDEYEKGSLWTPGFVSDANGYKSYYCKNTYRNNEWFKLICLGLPDYTYDMTKSPAYNLEEAEDALRAFDKSTRIRITTVTPAEVTQDMIDKAEVIYISNQYAFENMTKALNQLGITTGANFTNDFGSFSMVRSIYKYCMAKQKAVMINVSVGTLARTTNLVKLYEIFTMYQNPRTMEYFFDDMKGVKDGFNYIDGNGNVVIRVNKTGGYANYGENYIYPVADEIAFNNTLSGMSAAQIAAAKKARYGYLDTYGSSNTFETTYFTVIQGWGQVVNGIWQLGNDTNTWVDAIKNGERYLLFHWYGQGFMQNIQNMPKINHILKQDTFGVYVTNSVMNSSWEDVIYVDEFDEKYEIYYMIEATDFLYDLPTVERVEIYTDDGDGVIDTGLAPFLEIRASNSVAYNPSAEASMIDANATDLNHNKDVQFYPGYAVDVKAQMGGAQEKCFIIKVLGKKNIGTPAEPNYTEVVETTAVSVIVRDMFELN